ncbi:hypothetical protein K458DRAFT_120772 [Lentithecium fluviatile CBS 122367]|uniref:Uncharacterized protein n=1 Tax=Lentithecium fluviatile CBS 122367 TaxID=1168545 RepID=A0A6G1IMB7_9PLEO|nr:hypothetical protein K458DRAFT_120772 [Lentithecium fluviatile CBS 122367]
MPLALKRATAFIKQRAPCMSVSRYSRGGPQKRPRPSAVFEEGLGDSGRDGWASNSIIATWQISFEHIRRQMPTAAWLLSLMSLFDQQGIPDSLLHDQYGEDEDGKTDFDDIHMLSSFSLVGMSVNGQLYNKLELWQATYAALIDDSYPVGRPENQAVCQALFPHT